jgi:pimeloyl-ACP methyl ester carboxylesterase
MEDLLRENNIQVLQLDERGALRLAENWTSESSRACIHLFPFSSPFHREDLPLTPESYKARNKNFPLRVFLHPRVLEGAPYERFYILHNGLGESQPTIYDEMCIDLAERKRVPVIFLPLPLHYCRHYSFQWNGHDPYEPLSKTVSIITAQRIFQGVTATPERFINSYKQTLEETRHIIQQIDAGYHPYWRLLFRRGATLSLFGYSFGGFSALAFLLLEPERVGKVFLFESGGFIDQIDASVLFHRRDSVARALWEHYYIKRGPTHESEPLFSKREAERTARQEFEASLSERGIHDLPHEGSEEYERLYHERPAALMKKDGSGNYVYSEPYRVLLRSDLEARELWRDVMAALYDAIDGPKAKSLTFKELQLFKQIYLGHERVAYRRRIEEVQDRILIISGGADDIFPTKNLLDLGPDTGLALLQVPGITHWVKTKSGKRWHQWQRIVVDIMETLHSAGEP